MTPSGEGKGFGETSRRKMVKEVKGAELKRVEEREASVAEQRWARRSKTARRWMSLWIWGTSAGVARRIREKTGLSRQEESCKAREGSGAADGGGGGAAAAISFLCMT